MAAGIEKADAFIASTDGDNTNIVIAQIAQRRYDVPTVIARILDPLRAEWYEQQGLHTICPTRVAIDMLEAEVREAAASGGAPGAVAAGRGASGCTSSSSEPGRSAGTWRASCSRRATR